MITLSPLVSLYESQQVPEIPPPQLALGTISSQAFGNGSHPTTRLCSGAVDVLCRTQSIDAFLDVGTGTGILARIARARGVRCVMATDIDPLILQAAQQNAELDSKATPIHFAIAPPDQWGPRFHLIAANILEGPLHDLAPALVRALAPRGQLLLSGFTRRQTPALRMTYQTLGLELVSESEQAGWALLHLRL